MTDQLTIHSAALLRLDVTTNALRNLLQIVDSLPHDLRAELAELDYCDGLRPAIANAHAALEIAYGGRADVPVAIRSQRMPHDMAQRFLEEGRS